MLSENLHVGKVSGSEVTNDKMARIREVCADLQVENWTV